MYSYHLCFYVKKGVSNGQFPGQAAVGPAVRQTGVDAAGERRCEVVPDPGTPRPASLGVRNIQVNYRLYTGAIQYILMKYMSNQVKYNYK